MDIHISSFTLIKPIKYEPKPIQNQSVSHAVCSPVGRESLSACVIDVTLCSLILIQPVSQRKCITHRITLNLT